MTEINLPFSMKVVLGILVILGFSVAGAVDATPNYTYEEEFSLEESSSVPDNVDPVEFDSLSNSEQNAVLTGLSEYKESEFEDLPDGFGKEGYISINGQMYEYEVSPSVERNSEGVLIEGMMSIILFFLCVIVLMYLLNNAERQFDLTEKQIKVVVLVSIVVLGVFPLAQFMAFSMDDPEGHVIYLGPADSSADAVEYSSLSMEQQAYVSTLTSPDKSDRSGLSTVYSNPPNIGTDMDDEKLQELDTVVMKIDGEKEYHNFVTQKRETNHFGLTERQMETMYSLSALYIFFSLLLVVGIFEEDEENES